MEMYQADADMAVSGCRRVVGSAWCGDIESLAGASAFSVMGSSTSGTRTGNRCWHFLQTTWSVFPAEPAGGTAR
jgi:hypothetical protein